MKTEIQRIQAQRSKQWKTICASLKTYPCVLMAGDRHCGRVERRRIPRDRTAVLVLAGGVGVELLADRPVADVDNVERLVDAHQTIVRTGGLR